MGKRLKGTIRDWLIVLASLLDDAAVLAFVILALRFFKVEITLPIIIVIALLLIGFVFLMHRAIIPSLHSKKATGAEGMIGLEAKVIEALTPVGIIKVKGEYWTAKSVGGNIAVGEHVEVLGVKDLTLEVRRKG